MRKKRRIGPARHQRLRAGRPDRMWALDFQVDVTADGRQVRFLNVIDEYTREALATRASRSFAADATVAVLDELVTTLRRRPEHIRTDNGPELTAHALVDWCRYTGVDPAYIDPASPWQNGVCESFNGRFRDEFLACERFTTVATLDKARFGAESLERPALVRTGSGGWRLYVCCATPGSRHWWIDVLEADDLAGLADADARTVFPGDERTGVKDPVIRRYGNRWHAWICCHPLDEPGAEDRMVTAYATSQDGLTWEWRGTVLTGRPDTWDARGVRLTAVLPNGWASYDGRAATRASDRRRGYQCVPCRSR